MPQGRRARPPSLSVIVLIDGRRERAEACLRNILSQDVKAGLEVVLLDFASRSEPPLRVARDPAVRTLKLDPSIGYGPACALAVKAARAPVVAFVEEHVAVQPGWAAAMVEAHRGKWAGVGPEVRNATPGLGPSDIIFLTGFGSWTPPARRGESRLIPSHNSSYKRGILLGYGPELARLLSADIFLQWRLRADGHRLLLEPGAKIDHRSEAGLATLMRGYYLVMRSFAPLRAEFYHWSPLKRGLRLLFAPFGPMVRSARLLAGLARRRSPYFWKAAAGLWAVFGAHLAGALGEAVGLARGLAAGDTRFLVYEMNADRIRAKGLPD
jgi:GT2 family glycosyltransferase